MSTPATSFTTLSTSIYKRNLVEEWLKDIENVELFKQRVLRGELLTLNEVDRKFVLSFAGRMLVLHRAAVSSDPSDLVFIERLFEAGMDKAVDKKGLSILALYDLTLERHVVLHELGVPFVHPEKTRLAFILDKLNGLFQVENKPWEVLIPQTLDEMSFSEFLSIKSAKTLQYLFEFLYKNPQHSKNFFQRCLEWQKQFPEEMSTPLITYFKDNINSSCSNNCSGPLLTRMITENLLTPCVIERVYTQPAILSVIVKHSKFFWNFENLNFSVEFKEIYTVVKNFQITFWCLSLKRSATLSEAWKTLAIISNVITEEIKPYSLARLSLLTVLGQYCIKHVATLEAKENQTIWSSCKTYVGEKNLEMIVALGFDPNKLDKFQRNMVFYWNIPLSIKDKVKLDQLDIESKNALEQSVLKFKNKCRIDREDIIQLVGYGLRLRPEFPCVKEAAKYFPEDHEKLVVLVFLFLLKSKEAFRSVKQLGYYKDVIAVAKEIPELKPFYKEKPNGVFYSFQSPEEILAGQKYNPDIIPGYLAASQFVAALQGVVPKDKSFMLIDQLSLDDDDEIILLFRYLSQKPSLLALLTQYPQSLVIGSTCIHKSDQVRLILRFIHYLERRNESHWEDFDFTKITTKSNFEIHTESEQLNREVGFAYLRRNKRVSVLHNKFDRLRFFASLKDQFLSPIKIPGSFQVFRNPPAGQEHLEAPVLAISFTHIFSGSIFDQTEFKFERSQMICLRDAGMMIRNLKVPKLIKDSANEKFKWKNFRVFHELFNSKKPDLSESKNSEMLPSDFLRPTHLEMGIKGLTNPEHLFKKLRGWGEIYKDGWAFLEQMEGLGRTLVITLLNHIEFHKRNSTPYDWRKDTDCEKFLTVFVNYLNQLSGGFLGKPYDVGIKFSLQVARQILFWTDETATGYQEWFKRGEIPEGLYSKDLKVKVTKCDDFRASHNIVLWVDFKENMRIILLQIVAMSDKIKKEMPVMYYGDSYPGDA